jgi:hypothetical protein
MKLACAALLAAASLAARAPLAADASPLRVTELGLCEEVAERRCSGADRTFAPDVEAISFVTRVEGATGEAFVEHVWSFEGEAVRRIRLPIKSSSYRTWSTKTIRNLPGSWRAEVFDPLGRSLGSISFVVRAPER